MRPRPSRMHDALRDAFVVKVRDLLAHDEIFEKRGASISGLQRVLVVGDAHPLVGAQRMTRRIATISLQAL
ncbi:hypothetical protein D3C78_1462480 [compost metagenome]